MFSPLAVDEAPESSQASRHEPAGQQQAWTPPSSRGNFIQAFRPSRGREELIPAAKCRYGELNFLHLLFRFGSNAQPRREIEALFLSSIPRTLQS